MDSEAVPAEPVAQDRIPVVAPDILARAMDDGLVIVSPQAGKVRVLNEIGSAIWQLIDGQRSVAQIQAAMLETFAVEPDELRQDLEAFLAELLQRKLIVWRATP